MITKAYFNILSSECRIKLSFKDACISFENVVDFKYNEATATGKL